MQPLRHFPLFTLYFALAILVTYDASAENWSQYRGSNGDGKSTESIGHTDWNAKKPSEVWRTETPLGFSSFSIAKNRAFTLIAKDGKEHCIALDAATGKQLWSTALSSNDYNSGGGNAGAQGNKGGDGPRSTPTTDGDHVYVYDSQMVLTCMDAANGEIVWQRDIVKQHAGRNIKWKNATSPVLDGSFLYLAGGGAGETYPAIDKTNGSVVWKSGDDSMTHATPTLTTINGKKQLVFFMQSGLVGVDPVSGKQAWSTFFKFATSSAASPVVENDHIYCSAGYGVGAGLFKADGKTEPAEIWFKTDKALMNHWSTPVVHDGHLYGIFEFKKYGTAPLQCVELKTGKIKWAQRGFGPGNCILVGDKLVVLSDSGELILVDAKPDSYNETGRIDALQGKCWSTPAYSDGKIYVRSTFEAACYSVR